jgi:hypothetical protein
MTRKEKIQDQIDAAKKVTPCPGWIAIVVSTKLNKSSRKEIFGFRFAKMVSIPTVGHIINNHDGSISTVIGTV